MNKRRDIRSKLTRLVLCIVVFALLAASCCSVVSMLNMRKKALETASNDAIDLISEVAESRASLADSMLKLAENQTLLVAEGAQKLLEDPDTFLLGYNEESLPDLLCASDERHLVNVCVPEEYLDNIEKDGDSIVYGELKRDMPTGGELTVNEELYLGSLLTNEFSQIYHFRTPGTEDEYKGFAASYFCFADSGFDIIGDPKINTMLICYDARTRGWYQGAVEGYENGTLTESGVYWAEPALDAGGRGTSMVCSAPVVVNGEVVGVAGSGGLINDFADLVESSAIGSTGYSFMVSRGTSTVIINPNSTAESDTQSEVMLATVLSESSNPALVELSEDICAGGSGQIDEISFDGKEYFLAYSPLTRNDWTMVTVISRDDDIIMEGYSQLNNAIRWAFQIFIALILVLIGIAVFVSKQLAISFVNPIIQLKEGVNEISEGNWNHTLEISTGDEIEELGNAFNSMASSLDSYVKNLTAVTAEKERIGTELNVATHIQKSMLPCIFPAFPYIEGIDIYATMNPAKEVGGDFYDFFMIDRNHLAIVVADVSGKGVPAALFMVIGKTLIKDHSQSGRDLGEVFTIVNNLLCESNQEGMFITAFEGVLDITNGDFTYVNAGHEMPFLCRASAPCEAYKIKPGFVLAGMEGIRYKAGSIKLEPGDRLFQYTDGVTEATNAGLELFGMERLEASLNKHRNLSPKGLLENVKADIDEFVGEAPQFDDITMLCLDYNHSTILAED